eukprot:3940730-Rhodomonas_salina.3
MQSNRVSTSLARSLRASLYGLGRAGTKAGLLRRSSILTRAVLRSILLLLPYCHAPASVAPCPAWLCSSAITYKNDAPSASYAVLTEAMLLGAMRY